MPALGETFPMPGRVFVWPSANRLLQILEQLAGANVDDLSCSGLGQHSCSRLIPVPHCTERRFTMKQNPALPACGVRRKQVTSIAAGNGVL